MAHRAITRRRLLVAAGTVLAAPGCLGGTTSAPRTTTPTRPARLPGPLRILAPAGSVPADDRIGFGRASGVAVEVRFVASGPDLIALVASGYPADAVLARQDDIAVLGNLGLLRELDDDRIPNLNLVGSDFLDLDYDRHNRWSAPARYGVYGFGYRRDVVAETPADWASFFKLVPRYSLQGITLLPGPVEPVAAALAALDEDLNTDDDATLLRAQAVLLAAQPHVNEFTAAGAAEFGRGGLVLAMGTSADFDRILALPERAADTVFVLPDGRAEMWLDAWAVPVAGRHPLTGQAWIDHQLSAAAAARAWTESRLPAPEQAARRLLPGAIRADRLAALDPAVVNRYTLAAVTPAGLQKRAEIWARVLAA
jgi:spermidine/putrescine transport system substrate-binding protein